MLSLILDVGEIARRNKQRVGRLIPGFFLLCAPSFDCCTIRLEVDFRNRALFFFALLDRLKGGQFTPGHGRKRSRLTPVLWGREHSFCVAGGAPKAGGALRRKGLLPYHHGWKGAAQHH